MAKEATPAIDHVADQIQQNLGASRDVAVNAARDSLKPGMRRPASDDVDLAREQRAQAEGDEEDDDDTHGDEADADEPAAPQSQQTFTDPANPNVRKAVDGAEQTPL